MSDPEFHLLNEVLSFLSPLVFISEWCSQIFFLTFVYALSRVASVIHLLRWPAD